MVKLHGTVTILKSVASMSWTEEPAIPFDSGCRVSGCARRGDFTAQIEVSHPALPGAQVQAVLLCEDHVHMAENDLLVWDWYASGGTAVLGTGGIRERPKVVCGARTRKPFKFSL